MRELPIYRVEAKNSENEWEVYVDCDTWDIAEYYARGIDGGVKITKVDTIIEEIVLMEKS